MVQQVWQLADPFEVLLCWLLAFSSASDVQYFNSRRPKALNGNFDKFRSTNNKNQILNGRKWCTKSGRGPKVSQIVEKIQQSVGKLDFGKNTSE